MPASQRGWFNPGRILVESYFPLGIIRCWTWLDLDVDILVYPEPLPLQALPDSIETDNDGDEFHPQGSEDFHGLKNYVVGESLKHVAWKQYARGGELYSKEYASYSDQHLWLDYDALMGLDREARLSCLCFWLMQISRQTQDYGLKLPGVELPPAQGLEHRQQCLKALALFKWQTLGDSL